MATFQGKRVSKRWKVVLDRAWSEGVRFQLNSGNRTMSEQWALYNAYRNGSGVLAAFPSPNAPHIRLGRQAHAIDVDSFAYNDGENRLQAWLRKNGANAQNTVAGESWHLEITENELKVLADRFSDPLAGYPSDERRWIREYDRVKHSNAQRTKVLRITMRKRRKEIWKAAQKDGWRKQLRIKRYASLRARS